MPDFDTRKPQDPNQPNKVRIQVGANKLRPLLISNRPRMRLVANKLRTLLIGGGILLFVVTTIGLLIYSSSQQEDGGNLRVLKSTTPVDSGQQLVVGAGYHLYAIDLAGSNLTRLTDGAHPTWSPDGKQIAYTKYLKEPVEEVPDTPASAIPAPRSREVPYIFVMNADGSGGKQLLEKPAERPVWSPDGKKIAFARHYKGRGTVCDIYVMDADGSGEPTKLKTGPGCAYSPAWSPDGKRIAYSSNGTSGNDIYVVAYASSEEGQTNQGRALTDYARGGASDASWSPDGTEIAFTYTHRNFKSSVYKMDADGSGKTPLARFQRTSAGGNAATDSKSSPVWSPSGDQIAYERHLPDCPPDCATTRSISSPTDIYLMNSDGSNPTLVWDFENGQYVSGLDWRPLQ
jgi:Tol biopolymer transport system component